MFSVCRYELSYDVEKALCNGSLGATTATSAPSQAMNSTDRVVDKTVAGTDSEKHVVHSQNGDKSQSRGNYDGDKTQSMVDSVDRYKWARCKQPLPQKVMRSIGVPLPPEHVEVNAHIGGFRKGYYFLPLGAAFFLIF